MAFIEWTSDLSVGIDELDLQHKQWVSIINELHEAMKTGKASTVMADVIEKMGKYVAFHFTQEEKILNTRKYPGYGSHKSIHDRYSATLKKISGDFLSGKTLVSLEIMSSLKDWLIFHIVSEDKKYAPFLKKTTA